MNRSRLPIATDSIFLASTHDPSHWLSCGQTRPQIAGSVFVRFITFIASQKLPRAIWPMKPGMSMFTGQPCTQPGFLHARQRFASSTASSGV